MALEDGSTLVKVTISAEALKTCKQLIVTRNNDRPFLVQLPPADSKGAATTTDFKAAGRLAVGEDELVIQGPGSQVASASFNKTPLTISEQKDTSIKLKGLSAGNVTATAGMKTISLTLKDNPKPIDVTVDVVNAKVETAPRPTPTP